MVGPCSSCGPFNQYCGHHSAAYWPMQQYPQYNTTNNGTCYDDDDEPDYMYSSSSSSSSYSSVDCTLSLGTPSTRMTNEQTNKPTPHRNSVSSFCWDLLHPKQSSSSTPKPSRSSNNHAAAASAAADPLFVRRCANCDTTSTPLWRNGPRGPKSLCNACGIRFKKEERRAAAATTTVAAANNGPTAGMMDPHYYNGSWAHQYGQGTPQKMQCYGAPNEFRFIEDDRGSDSGIQFLSWLTHDRPSGLVHDFTR
ncbi:GATA transcription factor 19-like [Chenopodium quinoa]|nr:GATA transcription factor 19-like [Chenopodium quinoa]